ncbi:hypothetical protein D3OALGA1CA_3374 [Olavius algarvensis associated proteobacterium Delta 3]|nr:hypothetical protein D3OALGB2SA_3134 [Olavius algarvensis associated proteobacterium Delta 3]CAB5133347.1 hypothetical protein D3OALGA1CA_3374 [Olavius algarvensis associated proteobacterium Delta 3]
MIWQETVFEGYRNSQALNKKSGNRQIGIGYKVTKCKCISASIKVKSIGNRCRQWPGGKPIFEFTRLV